MVLRGHQGYTTCILIAPLTAPGLRSPLPHLHRNLGMYHTQPTPEYVPPAVPYGRRKCAALLLHRYVGTRIAVKSATVSREALRDDHRRVYAHVLAGSRALRCACACWCTRVRV
jgi:hypothetical protein